MVEVGEDRESRPPAVPGRGGVPARVVRVAEARQRFGFVVPIVVALEQRERLPVGGNGIAVPAEMVVRETNAVPGARLSDAVAEFLMQHECPLTVL